MNALNQAHGSPARVMFQARGPKDGADPLSALMMIFSFSNPPPFR